MAEISMTTANEPDGAPRIGSLDILRGIAILGILFMNINDMGGSAWSFVSNDIRHLGWSSADQVAWWLREIFANGTARCMLEMLFGVGMVILTDRAANAVEASADDPASKVRRALRWLFGPAAVLRSYYWRSFVLFLFGLVHLFILLWLGDILHTYGLAAMVAFLFRRLGPKALLGIGLIMGMMQLVFGGHDLYSAQQRRIEAPRLEAKAAAGGTLTQDEKALVDRAQKRKIEKAKQEKDFARRVAIEDHERSAATGTFLSWAMACWSTIGFIWGFADSVGPGIFLEPLFVWEAASTMLIGAALYKWGVIQGRRSPSFYLRTMLIAYAIGLGGRAWSAAQIVKFDDYPYVIYAAGEVTRLATTLGHISAVYVLLGTAFGVKMLRPFEAAGRTALTIYIAQTIICLWILYPPFALGLYGQQGWMSLMLTALAINALLLWAANWYVGRFDIAPVEWAWRSIIAGRALPWRKGVKRGDNPVPAGVAAA